MEVMERRSDTSPTYLIFQTLLPLFWTLTYMIGMELNQTDAVFSRTAMVLFLCKNISSRNDLKIHRHVLELVKNIGERISIRGPTPCRRGCRACPLPRGPPGTPPTSTPTPYIHFQGEKNQGEGFIAFYDTEPPQAQIFLGMVDLESVRSSGEGRSSSSSSSTIVHHQFHDAHRRA